MASIEAHSCDREGCAITEHGNKLGSWLVAVVNFVSATVAVAKLKDAHLLPQIPNFDDDDGEHPVRIFELCGFQCLMQVVSPLYTVGRNGSSASRIALPPVDAFDDVEVADAR